MGSHRPRRANSRRSALGFQSEANWCAVARRAFDQAANSWPAPDSWFLLRLRPSRNFGVRNCCGLSSTMRPGHSPRATVSRSVTAASRSSRDSVQDPGQHGSRPPATSIAFLRLCSGRYHAHAHTPRAPSPRHCVSRCTGLFMAPPRRRRGFLRRHIIGLQQSLHHHSANSFSEVEVPCILPWFPIWRRKSSAAVLKVRCG